MSSIRTSKSRWTSCKTEACRCTGRRRPAAGVARRVQRRQWSRRDRAAGAATWLHEIHAGYPCFPAIHAARPCALPAHFHGSLLPKEEQRESKKMKRGEKPVGTWTVKKKGARSISKKLPVRYSSERARGVIEAHMVQTRAISLGARSQ